MRKQINSCAGKHPYKTKQEANVAAKHLNRSGGLRVVSYKCTVCQSVHIGHDSKGRRLNPKDKFKKKLIDYDYEQKTHIADRRFLK